MTPNLTCLGYLIRHGELNNMRVWDGWSDMGLSETGKFSAEKAAQYLSFERLGRVISSGVARTIQTADIIMNGCNVLCPFSSDDPNFRAWNVGTFTGKEKTPERLAEFEYYLDHPDVVIPEGESRNQFHDRIQVILPYLASPYAGEPTAFALHNSVIKELMGIGHLKEAVDPGGVVRVDMDEKGELIYTIVLGEVLPEVGIS